MTLASNPIPKTTPTIPASAATSVIVIGGGLAGLAAASALASSGCHVQILESRGRLGGRASSFTDPSSGLLIDTCQHVSMGCCTNFAHFCRTVGIETFLSTQPCLFFMTPEGRVSRFQSDQLPPPLHLARSFLSAHWLTGTDKLRILFGLASLRLHKSTEDPPFADWLRRHRQSRNAIKNFWGLILTSALNETPDRLGLRYARKVLLDGFMGDRRGFEIQIPHVPLARLYGKELMSWFESHGIEIHFNRAVESIQVANHRVACLELRGNVRMQADYYIAAVPFDRLLAMLPANTLEDHSCFSNLRFLEKSPITSVHLWYDRPVMTWPHLVLVDCIGQWVFNRGQVPSGDYYLQVVVSASRQFHALGHEEVQMRVTEELSKLFPDALLEHLKRARVITEHSATFSAVPGVDQWRPLQTTPIDNFFLAGDWTDTAWPATMEGAVLSGYLASEALHRYLGKEVNFAQKAL